MLTLVLNKIQLSKIDNATFIEKPTNEKYLKQAEENNKRVQQIINSYAEAYKNATEYFVK